MWPVMFWEMAVFKGELGKKETLDINLTLVCSYTWPCSPRVPIHLLFFFFFSPPINFFFPLIVRHFISSLIQEDTAQPFFKLILCLWYHISSTDPFSVCTKTIYPVSCVNISCSASSILICPMLSTMFLFNLLHILIFIHTVLDYKNLCID